MRTLRWRLTLWYGGTAALILVVLAAILYLSARSSLVAIREADVRETAESAGRILEETGSPKSAVGEVRRRDVRTVWAIGEARRPDVMVAVRGGGGRVLAATEGEEDPPEPSTTYPEVYGDGRYLTTTYESGVSDATLVAYAELPAWDPVLQRLLLVEAAAVAGALALMFGLGPGLAGRALRPLKSVSAVAGELEEGNLGSRVDLPELKGRRDEVGEVARSFDAMAESLEGRFEAERESQEALRRFVADASHELRTPLTSILGYLDVLEEGGDRNPEARRRSLGAMREEGGRMARLVEDLLVLARLDAGAATEPLAKEAADLADLAREVAGRYPGRRVRLDVPEKPVPVLAGREAVRRVISNLLSNAAKHTPPEKRILVTVGREGDEATLRVADEGSGIPEGALPYVFQRFYRAESSRAGDGSGLGLAIVRETVEALGGRVEAESSPGEGSTFTVWLPLSKEFSERT